MLYDDVTSMGIHAHKTVAGFVSGLIIQISSRVCQEQSFYHPWISAEPKYLKKKNDFGNSNTWLKGFDALLGFF